ncbi:MAG: glycoside hydrolase family 2 protein, partial [archaeon]|nr:glycoside hydrolase family 2 protein [archaeon]
PQQLQQLMQDAADANMNIVRVWGGGIYQHQALYDEADRLGIMIWQEFMFATSMSPRDDAFLASVSEEVRHQVRRLAYHCSIVMWSGNNENESALGWFQQTIDNRDLYVIDYAQLYYTTILTTLLEEDQTRPFRPSSPTNGMLTSSPPFVGIWGNPSNQSIGDLHYYNYDALCIDVSSFPNSRFVSEYGWQSFPSLQTWSPVTEPQDWSPFSPLMEHRQHHFEGTQQIQSMASRMFPSPVVHNGQGALGFDAWIYVSQAAQADCIRAQSEHYRRSRDLPANTMGAIYWQLNDIWQGPTWASVEYGGSWKMLHYAAADFFAPVASSIFEDAAGQVQAWVVSDLMVSATCQCSVEIYSWSLNALLWNTSSALVLDPLNGAPFLQASASQLMKQAGCLAPNDCVAVAHVTVTEPSYIGALAESKFYFSWGQGGLANVVLPSTLLSVSNPLLLNTTTIAFTFTSSGLAPYVWLTSSFAGHFSRNGLFMVPNQSLQITFIPRQSSSLPSLHDFMKDLQFKSLQSAY